MSGMKIEKAGIIGLGLIGGSLARAMKAKAGVRRIAAFGRNPEPLGWAVADRVIDEYSTEGLELFADCDIVFICVPVNLIGGYVRRLAEVTKPDCLLTDAGSTKASIVGEMERVGITRFIGGHPMAGSEKAGYDASSADLFEGACYIITPSPGTPRRYVETLTELAGRIGAMPMEMNAESHDRAVAAVSHAPHVAASALANLARGLDSDGSLRAIAAGGFRDTTRVASADGLLWSAICMENRARLRDALTAYRGLLEDFDHMLEAGDEAGIRAFFSSAKGYRDGLTLERTGDYE